MAESPALQVAEWKVPPLCGKISEGLHDYKEETRVGSGLDLALAPPQHEFSMTGPHTHEGGGTPATCAYFDATELIVVSSVVLGT